MDIKCMYRPQTESVDGQETDNGGPHKSSKTSSRDDPFSNEAASTTSRHQVTKTPLKVSHKSKPPDEYVTSSSLPVSFSPPQPSPPRSTPPPPKLTSPPSSPVRPKNTKDLVRKFENQIAARKVSLSVESSPRRSVNNVNLESLLQADSKEQTDSSGGLCSDRTSAEETSSSTATKTNEDSTETQRKPTETSDNSKKTSDNSKETSENSKETSDNSKEASDNSKQTFDNSKDTSDDSKESSDSSTESSNNSKETSDFSNPPPVPTSRRPLLNLARAATIDLADSQPASKVSALSQKSPDNGKNSSSSSCEGQPVVHKGRKSKLIGDYEYHYLLEDKNKETGLVQVVVGPHFSFQIS